MVCKSQASPALGGAKSCLCCPVHTAGKPGSPAGRRPCQQIPWTRHGHNGKASSAGWISATAVSKQAALLLPVNPHGPPHSPRTTRRHIRDSGLGVQHKECNPIPGPRVNLGYNTVLLELRSDAAPCDRDHNLLAPSVLQSTAYQTASDNSRCQGGEYATMAVDDS